VDNAGVASALREIAALLAQEGLSRFGIRACERGARAVEALSEDVAELARTGRLQDVPGVGSTLSRTIVELRETGRSELLPRLREAAPPGAAELAAVLTRRQMTTLHEEALGIASLADLRAACEAGRGRRVFGFGERSERRLLDVIEALETARPSVHLV
jgi:DNA polymerase (family X)